MKIVILGAGAYGSVLGKLAERNHHTVAYYDPYKFPQNHLNQVLKHAEIMFYVAPASAAPELLPKLPLGVPLVCASKGFLSDRIFQKFADFAALGGAGFASDFERIFRGDATEPLTLTTSSKLVETALGDPQLHFEYSEDTLGIMLCGALKNVYALGAGLLDCAGSTAYLDLASQEMAQILTLNDCDPHTAELACGRADLELTCTKQSRNFQFGQRIATLQKQSLEDQHLFGKVAPHTLRQRLNLPRLAAQQTIEAISIIRSLDGDDRFLIPPDARLFITIVNQMQPIVDSLKTAKKASEHKPRAPKTTRARAGKTARERAQARKEKPCN